MNRLYFCAYPDTFDKNCQIIEFDGIELWKEAYQWMKTNGYNHVYIYDMEYRYVWDFCLSPS